MAKNRNTKLEESLRANKAVMGLLRKEHFESGGDLAAWRGRSNVYTDRKKQKDKHACRKKSKSEW